MPALNKHERKHIRIWPILFVGFGALIGLIGLSGRLAFVRSRTTYRGISAVYDTEHQLQGSLGIVRSNIAKSAILSRDFLLDSTLSADVARSDLQMLRQSTSREMAKVKALTPERDSAKFHNVEQQLEAYWSSVGPLLTGSERARSHLGYSVIQKEILPQREGALRVLDDIEQLSADAFKQRKQEIDGRHAELAYYLARSIGITLLIALTVAALSLHRTYTLERTAELQHRKVLATEEELRRLSKQIVGAQEEERRALSRELHDQVGQVLTALRMSLGNAELACDGSDARVSKELDLAKRLAGQALRSVRDLAMGLRPTMLDDLGLQAALEWHARQHSKVYAVPVSVNVDARLDQLTDAQRTCIYRMVQEGLNNSAKHAQAGSVDISVRSMRGRISVDIADDGIGFDSEREAGRGLGLLGMKERVAQVGGSIVIGSKRNAGTTISANFPVLETRE